MAGREGYRLTAGRSDYQLVRAGATLAAILREPLPVLPGRSPCAAARQLRQICGRQAAAVWRHPTWGALVGWLGRRVPDADPVTPAVAAIRRAHSFDGRRLARYVIATARNSTVSHWPSWLVPLSDVAAEELAAPPLSCARDDDSLWREARELLEAVGVTLSAPTEETVSASIDIAVDWWDQFAGNTGLTGQALVHAVRHSAAQANNRRLRSLFDGPQAKPLVTLLLGDGQLGRRVRQTAGVEAGLVYWALAVRHAQRLGARQPVPPAEVRAGWAATLALVERALTVSPPASGEHATCYARALHSPQHKTISDGCRHQHGT